MLFDLKKNWEIWDEELKILESLSDYDLKCNLEKEYWISKTYLDKRSSNIRVLLKELYWTLYTEGYNKAMNHINLNKLLVGDRHTENFMIWNDWNLYFIDLAVYLNK